ncbi:hypothetical protein SLITO_v1c06670 [Spiroplasma litorale]|uniref:Uncharacterized protein n=1 Tax=Spiroplasma litorale TaxID=216942 RepID=A0A0K1W2A1_9MOLU|nr:hypothetical protein [Spiroplasma litorale]AKX34296.1 hypothetical protein SLITO_v1c06670 [Spiroplasma litorale]
MAKKDLPANARKAWTNATNCNCGAEQDSSERGHKKCSSCNKQMEYGAY